MLVDPTSVFQNLTDICLSGGFNESSLLNDAISYSQSEFQPYLRFGFEICMVKVLSA